MHGNCKNCYKAFIIPYTATSLKNLSKPVVMQKSAAGACNGSVALDVKNLSRPFAVRKNCCRTRRSAGLAGKKLLITRNWGIFFRMLLCEAP
jgi:hypothetical protein